MKATLLLAATLLLPGFATENAAAPVAATEVSSSPEAAPRRPKKEKPRLTQEMFQALVPLFVRATQEVAAAMEKIQDEASARQFEGELRDAMLRHYFLQGAISQFDLSGIDQEAASPEIAGEMSAAEASIQASSERIMKAGFYGSKLIKALFWH